MEHLIDTSTGDLIEWYASLLLRKLGCNDKDISH